jgi:hypothetical protein
LLDVRQYLSTDALNEFLVARVFRRVPTLNFAESLLNLPGHFGVILHALAQLLQLADALPECLFNRGIVYWTLIRDAIA